MKNIFSIIVFLFYFFNMQAQHNLKVGKDVMKFQNGKTLLTDVLFLSAGKYYFTDTTGTIFYMDANRVTNASGKFAVQKDFGGYHENMLHVYKNATVGSSLVLSGAAIAGFGALISAAFDDSQAVAVPMMAIGGIAALTGFVTLTIAFNQGKNSEIKMVAVPYK